MSDSDFILTFTLALTLTLAFALTLALALALSLPLPRCDEWHELLGPAWRRRCGRDSPADLDGLRRALVTLILILNLTFC